MNEADYEQAVNSFYEGLYRFAHSLAGNADDACELTQEAFARPLQGQGVALHDAVSDFSRLETPRDAPSAF